MVNVSLYRIVAIVWMSVSFFLQIWWFQKRHRQPWSAETSAQFERLIVKQAATYRETAIRLQGLLIKFGQFLSTRADLLPDVFLRELSTLVDQVPTVPWEQVRPLLDAAWGGAYGEVLERISAAPVASASIGVVYKGYLHSGEAVAVKVRRPGIERIIRADFQALRIVTFLTKRFTKLGKMADLPALYQQVVSIIGDELDFQKELANGEYFATRFHDFEGIEIPTYYARYSTRSVLVMSWMESARVTDLAFIEEHGLDRHVIAERLVRSFAIQLFQGGRFHADPHPGNILLREDGTIVLIDFGMIGTIRDEDARAIRVFVEALIFGNADQIVESLERLRFLLPHADKAALRDVVMTLFRAYTSKNTPLFDDAAFERVLIDVQNTIKKQPIQLPSEFAFLGRTLSTLVGVLHILDPGIDLVAVARPVVTDWLNAQGDAKKEQEDGLNWLKMVRDWASPLVQLPVLLTDSLRAVERNREADRRQHYERLTQQAYLRNHLFSFIVFALTGVGAYLAWDLKQWSLFDGTGLICVISLVIMWQIRRKHHRFLQRLRKGI